MVKSGIEYLTHTWSPVTGCAHTKAECPVKEDCWARSMAHRFPGRYGRGFWPTPHWERFREPMERKKPARIGVCFMGDLWSPGVRKDWRASVRQVVRACPQHTFVFLTKNGAELEYGWPANAWVGVSITGVGEEEGGGLATLRLVNAPVRWVSFEPLLGPFTGNLEGIGWVVIGAKGGPHPMQPEREWVAQIEMEAQERGIPIFEKDNLIPLVPERRREYPAPRGIAE